MAIKFPSQVLGIVPARGGSKGIPRKNIRQVAGKPLLSYVLDAALKSRALSRVVVSTDDSEIGSVAQANGAEVVWRPAELSGDNASSEQALMHALDYLRDTENYSPMLLVFLQCTSPLTLAEDIDGTVEALLKENADSALAVTPFHYFIWERTNDGAVGVNHQKGFRPMRQNRQPQYLEAGAVVAMYVEGFRKAGHRFFGRTALYEIPPERVLEIDEPNDLLIAEVKLNARNQLLRKNQLASTIKALVLDFDGVFTDNKVIVSDDGTEAVTCSRADSWGIKMLQSAGLPILVLSFENNPVVKARCKKLGLECLQGQKDKASTLLHWLEKTQFNARDVAYVGNDLNDLACMEIVGTPIAVNDAHPAVKKSARLVLDSNGGNGAIRELSELILDSRTNVSDFVSVNIMPEFHSVPGDRGGNKE